MVGFEPTKNRLMRDGDEICLCSDRLSYIPELPGLPARLGFMREKSMKKLAVKYEP